MQLEMSLRSIITDAINEGQTEADVTLLISSAIDIVKSERQAQAERARQLQSMRYHLFISPQGQRYSVNVGDLKAFCVEHWLNHDKMLELSNGGRGGLPEYKGWRRGPGSRSLLNGQPYQPLPELPVDDNDDKPALAQRLFKPKPVQPAYNHRPTIRFTPKES
jgi:hypothetical protein